MANLERSNAILETSQIIRVPLIDFKMTTGILSSGTPSAGEFGRSVGGWSTGGYRMITETANGNTKTDRTMVRFALPQNYEDGEDIVVRVRARTSPTANTTATIDMQAYKSNEEGGAGSDLNGTAAQACNSATWADYSFTIDGTTLAAGDELELWIEMIINDSGGTSSAIGHIGSVELLTSTRM